ncbi:MAG TPA: ABC transporter permease [Rubrivivax sp.]|nr:ABC transporter permease [Rubrivivax sp.]
MNPRWLVMVAALLVGAGVAQPGGPVGPLALVGMVAMVISLRPLPAPALAGLGLAALGALALAMLRALGAEGAPRGAQAVGLWLALAGWALYLWCVLDVLAGLKRPKPARLLAPALLGVALLFAWEVLVIGWEVPKVLLPVPHAVGDALVARWPVLWPDFRQTAVAVIAGWALGSGAGLAAALLADRFDFLRRGLLPLAGLAGAVPIVGIAPIMVMWFGFDWQSKAAVAAVVTFFPMLVNTLAGLASVDAMHRDLMRTYGAGHAATLMKLRMPSALPFVFNALKINSTLALISAIVAEFFGSPIVGLGFRISAEVARMNVDIVWAAIALAALAGSLFYGLVALVERVFTFWHPSYRG